MLKVYKSYFTKMVSLLTSQMKIIGYRWEENHFNKNYKSIIWICILNNHEEIPNFFQKNAIKQ